METGGLGPVHSRQSVASIEIEATFCLAAKPNNSAFAGGGSSHPNLDKEIHTLDFLTGRERGDLLVFLNSLTGEMPRNIGPEGPDVSRTPAQK